MGVPPLSAADLVRRRSAARRRAPSAPAPNIPRTLVPEGHCRPEAAELDPLPPEQRPASEAHQQRLQRILDRLVQEGGSARMKRERPQVRLRPTIDYHFRTAYRNDLLQVLLSDVIQDCPDEVAQGLLEVVLASQYRRKVPEELWQRYLRYRRQPSIVKRAQVLFLARNRSITPVPKGKVFDLDEVFAALNLVYFDTQLPRPALAWTVRHARTTLGYYLEDFDIIVINSVLDRRGVPRFALEGVLYHEMLHKRQEGLPHRGGRRRHHPPSFQAAERRFLLFEPARKWCEDYWGAAD